jgi:hypothetical protein
MTMVYRFALWLDGVHPMAMVVFLAVAVVGLRSFEGWLVRRDEGRRVGRS